MPITDYRDLYSFDLVTMSAPILIHSINKKVFSRKSHVRIVGEIFGISRVELCNVGKLTVAVTVATAELFGLTP